MDEVGNHPRKRQPFFFQLQKPAFSGTGQSGTGQSGTGRESHE
jgi:hypothetical protein